MLIVHVRVSNLAKRWTYHNTNARTQMYT